MNHTQLVSTITDLLKEPPAATSSVLNDSLSPYLPQLTPPIIHSVLSSSALHRYPSALLSFLSWARCHSAVKPLTLLPLCPLLSLLNSLISHHKFNDANSILHSQILSEHPHHQLHLHLLHPARSLPPKALLDTSIFAYCRSGWPHLASQIFKKMKRHKPPPNLLTLNTLLSSLVKKYHSSRSTQSCNDMFNDAVKLGVTPSVITFNILINGYCLEYKFKDAVELLKIMDDHFKFKPDNASYNTILDALRKKGRLHDMRDLLSDMKSKGLFPNRNTYNILVDVYCRIGWLKDAAEVIELMTRDNLLPDVLTYNTLINGMCNSEKIDDTFRLRDEMEELKLKDAYELLSSADKRGYILDEVSYGTLIVGYFKKENLKRAMEVLDEMKEKDIYPSIITYNSMIGGLCKLGKTYFAITKLNELLENGLVPDETTYNTIIHGYCWEGNVEKAFKFHNEMVEKSFKPDIYTCNILLRGLCVEGMLEKASKLFKTWILKGKDLDAISYNTLITALCKEGRHEDALELVVEMEEKKLGPDSYTFNAIIEKTDDKRDAVASEPSDELDSASLAYSEQINELCVEERYKDAIHIFTEQTQKGIPVNKSTYITLINGLIKRRKSVFR
ncbi:hypothetical protein OROGR_016185 [Orobanche gracilis]